MTVNQVRWNGATWLLVGDLEDGGAIASVAQFKHGGISEAYLRVDGRIEQFGKTIGHRDDLTLLEPIEAPEPTGKAFVSVMDRMLGILERP